VKLSWWSCVEGADERRAIPISRSRVSQDWRGRVESHDSRTREISSCEKDLWIDKLQISAGNRKEPLQLKGIENDPVSRSRLEGR
jgi:hypothetical protein